MADVNRGNRPLSPHLQIYRLQITSVLSILHRITGCALLLGAVLVVWWFTALAVSEPYFTFVDGLLTSWPGLLVLVGSLWALWFHLLNGVRHLVWDTGNGFDLGTVTMTGWSVVIGSVVLTVLTLVVI